MTSFLQTSAGERLLWTAQQPGGYTVTTAPAPVVDLDVGELAAPEYWELCRAHAMERLSLGATPEALLWVNIGVEALIDLRLQALCVAAGDPTALEHLTAQHSAFGAAEDAVVAQFPELRGQIKWPEGQRAPSRYWQLKELCKLVPVAAGRKELTAHYEVAARGRNALVHGRTQDLIPTADVQAALAALDGLAERLVLEDSR